MGQWTHNKDSVNISSQHYYHYATASSIHKECDKELMATPGEKSNMTSLEISSLRDVIKANEPSSIKSSKRDEPKNSSTESNIVNSINRVEHDVKDMELGDELCNKYNLTLDALDGKSSESFQEAFDKA